MVSDDERNGNRCHEVGGCPRPISVANPMRQVNDDTREKTLLPQRLIETAPRRTGLGS